MFLKRNKSRQSKIFIIGFNKTGTTSLGAFFEQNGFKVFNQRKSELLLEAYIKRDFNKIIKTIKDSNSQVFQDVPFSMPYLYVTLSQEFKDAKFILTSRSNSRIWFDSLVKFHSNFFTENNRIPTRTDLENSNYVKRGWSWLFIKELFSLGDDYSGDIYDSEVAKKIYQSHLDCSTNFFKNNKDSFLEIDVSKPNASEIISKFVGFKAIVNKMPHINSIQLVENDYKLTFLNSK
tara:strand:- start:1529 stop:2230 length:702 start_codon:yes stop_codon:yes gene_type:complete